MSLTKIEWCDKQRSGGGATGSKNAMWKGGRTITQHGYIKIRVGTSHHLADSKGYAYEHRLVAERVLGRNLTSYDIVHHIDGDKKHNSPSNLKIVSSNGHHFVYHRKRHNLRLPGEPNLEVKCTCGCGAKFLKYDEFGRPRMYLSGHNPPPPATAMNAILQTLAVKMTVDELQQSTGLSRRSLLVALSRLANRGQIVRIKCGIYGPPGSKQRSNRLIVCACGCGAMLYEYDKHWRIRKFITGHNNGWRS